MKRLPSIRFLPALLALVCAASAAQAQTTHTVSVNGFSFTPAALTIDVGDTVLWVWGGFDFHDVQSGVGGIPDGIFSSGVPVLPPNTFSVTFDQTFLDANPVPAQLYPYYCSIHEVLGMSGTIKVETPPVATIRNGTGSNPVSFLNVSGPTIGGTWDTTIDIVTPGAVASVVVVVGTGPATIPTPFGELLIDLSAPFLVPPNVAVGVHSINIPNSCSLFGLTVFTQGVTFKPGDIRFVNALDLTFGS